MPNLSDNQTYLNSIFTLTGLATVTSYTIIADQINGIVSFELNYNGKISGNFNFDVNYPTMVANYPIFTNLVSSSTSFNF